MISEENLLPRPQKILRPAEPASFSGPFPELSLLEGHTVGAPLPLPIMDAGPTSDLPPEGYELSIERDRLIIRYADDEGAFYAVQTLRQLLDLTPEAGSLECMTVSDWPDLRDRGFMLDISRCKVPTMDTLRELVELMGELKLNQLQLYTEHTFAYKGHEEVWQDASPMTPEEIRELDVLCRARAVELVPNQNSFGHMRPWLSLPAYRHLAEAPDGFEDPWGNWRDYPYSLAPVEPATIPFLDDLYTQLLPNFRSARFNVNCDETFDLGQGRSKALCDERGKGNVYADYLLKIRELVGKHGKQMQFWADIIQQHPETISRLPKDMTAIEWGYEADHPFDENCARLADAGLPFYVAPGTSSWNSMGGRWGVARENIASALGAARKHGAQGMLLTEWGNFGYLQPFVSMIAPLAYAAGGAWNGASLRSEPWQWLAGYLKGPGSSEDSGPAQVADALRLLGELYRLHPNKIPNTTIYGIELLLFDLPMYAKHLEVWDSQQRDNAREILRTVNSLLERSPGGSNRLSEAREETALAARLIELAVDVGDETPPDVLLRKLDEIEAEHHTLWHRRFRPGGYEISRSFLRKRVDSLVITN